MRVVYLAREYPPEVYGGAGVHLEHLARAMARLAEVEVRCFGERPVVEGNPRVVGCAPGDAMFDGREGGVVEALKVLHTGMRLSARPICADIVHCHTWYSHLGGILARLAYGVPMVVTVHSLEPLRPWKREQLGRGYDLSSWVERTALEMADRIIAVSETDRGEILRRFAVEPSRVHVVPNGVDPEAYRPVSFEATLGRHGIDASRPFVLFLGRITRQKGILHFLRAAELLSPETGVVLAAGAADSPEVEREVTAAIEGLRAKRRGVVWIRKMLPREEAVALYSAAAVFCCPSVYEPFGIINLEAMACETPVVATAVGGIREVVVPGETGLLVPFTPRSQDDPDPAEPARLARDLAGGIEKLMSDAGMRAAMGRQGRRRVVEHYGWDRIAERTHDIYRGLVTGPPGGVVTAASRGGS